MTSVFVLLVSGQVNVDDFTERFKEGRNLRLRGCRKRASEATNKDSVVLFPLDWLHVSICSESIRESRAIILIFVLAHDRFSVLFCLRGLNVNRLAVKLLARETHGHQHGLTCVKLNVCNSKKC